MLCKQVPLLQFILVRQALFTRNNPKKTHSRLVSRRASLVGQLVEEAPVVDSSRGVLVKEPVLVLGEAVELVPLRLRRRPEFDFDFFFHKGQC